MTGTHGSLHHAIGGRITELPRVRLGINLLHAWRKGYRGPLLLEQTAIGLQCAGVLGQVGLVIELCWIEEDAHYGGIVFLHAALHQ